MTTKLYDRTNDAVCWMRWKKEQKMRTIGPAALITSIVLAGSGQAQTVLPPGDCPNCRQGEGVAYDRVIVEEGDYTYVPNSQCMAEPNLVRDFINEVTGIAPIYSGNYSGGINNFLSTPQGQQLSSKIRGDVERLIDRSNTATARCQMLCVTLPTALNITRTWGIERPENTQEFHNCGSSEGGPRDADNFGRDCANGFARFTSAPVTEVKGNLQVTCAVFQNWNADADREARLYVYYRR